MSIPIGRDNASLVDIVKTIDSNIATLLPIVENIQAATLKEFQVLLGKVEAIKMLLDTMFKLFTLAYFIFGVLLTVVLIIVGVT
ncbi:hypothetical protein LTR70_007957 [Exophiala xenobiotica]|uniref:Uncharacterized protein n=1 Tax=Lithohypha guttulata TaxID=1690604 RepID=A0ABR0K2E2_9EURO|nr:hypothetical protein LTR24_007803 [Lithohypha guttulata]KAK5312791.1 hypothetical protein LTR70_007957 [Exophiala xenobiotica]